MEAVLDTNHYVALIAGGPMALKLANRASSERMNFATTIISSQEITQGWLAEINRHASGPSQVFGYQRFHHSLLGFARIRILSFDSESAALFLKLRAQGSRTGTMDLKIASICLVHGVLLLTRNLVDFKNLLCLRVENWLD